MESVYEKLAKRAIHVRDDSSKRDVSCSRVIIAFAGPPGSGKSTIAAEVARRINQHSGKKSAIVVPMDGFHYSRAHLDSLPNSEEAHARRGAYWTFDGHGVVELVKRLRESQSGSKSVISAPSFDHMVKDPVQDMITIETDADIAIVEGNWLLLDREPWREIVKYVDDTWLVTVEPSLALERVARRHLESGIEGDWESAIARARGNDLLNGEEVMSSLVEANVVVQSVDIENSPRQDKSSSFKK